MFNVIDEAGKLLNSVATSAEEILFEFTAQYKVKKTSLPSTQLLLDFTSSIPEQDEALVFISDESSTVQVGATAWMEEYEDFISNLYDNDEIIVDFKIKKMVQDGVLNVYCLNQFSDFLSGRTYTQLLDIFTELFQKCENRIVFHLLDTNGSLRTMNLMFTDNAEFDWENGESRSERLKKCEEASLFLDRVKYPLLPQDFTIVEPIEGGTFQKIQKTFDKLRCMLSYVYLSNSAYFANETVILQFNPALSAWKYSFDDLASNTIIPKIYDWVFMDDNCVDKASIARKIINIYCHDREDILCIDNKVFNSIRSDYLIYQKNHAEQYIDMKNKISECIVENARQLQDLSHDAAEAFRNNFVAVIVFILTVLLTDSIDFTQFLGKNVSPNVTAVCGVFTIGSLLYLIATIAMGNLKWKWLEESYHNLKKNYKGTLDDQDIEEAFCHDEPIEMTKKQFKGFRWKMIILWAMMIFAMFVFTVILRS